MTALLLAFMGLELLLLLALLSSSRRHVRQSLPGVRPDASSPETGSWPTYPRVALIVPLTGNTPGMAASLESLLTQPYPNYETVLVTRDPDDPATGLVQRLLTRHPRVRHVVSGPASGCSQKNHNILAGLGILDDAAAILVFCDSTHEAPPHFLQTLIYPLVTGAAVMTTGFHRIIPGDTRLATLGMLQTVLTIHLLHSFYQIVMPWGGATAILRSAFYSHGVDRVWGATVLDDLPLGQRLLRSGIRVTPVAAAIMNTRLSGQTMAGWSAWLTRQLLYTKYCLPLVWLAASLAVVVLAGPILLAGLAVLGGLLGLVTPLLAWGGLGFLVALTGIGAWCRTLVPHKAPWGRWLLSFYANIFMACWCYFKTWGLRALSWRGISYRVAWGGWVREIILKPGARGRTP